MSAIFDEATQFVDSGGQPVVNGFIYIGDQGADPTLNPKDIFSDRALSVPLANPQRTDANGRAVNKIWTDGRYSMRISDLNDTQLYQELDNGEDAGTLTLALGNVLGSNVITADASPTITTLNDTAQFIFKVTAENTTDAVTLNIDGLGAKDIRRNFDQVVGKGKFKVNQIVIVAYNATTDDFEWVNENAKVRFDNKGTDIAAAATVDLSIASGNFIDITGDGGGAAISSFGTVLVGVAFGLRFPGTTPATITSSSVANPTNILTAAAHGISSGADVIISGHSGAVPNLNNDPDEDGRYVNTNVDSTNFTIPVNVTTGGTGGTVYGIPKITHGANIICPGALDIELRTNDIIELVSLGAGVFFVEAIRRADGGATIIASLTQAQQGLDNVLAMSSRRVSEAIAYRGGKLFAASGTYNVPPGTTSVLVEQAAGGGGGGGAGNAASEDGGGAGAGGYIQAIVTVTPGGSETVTVGTGGAGSTSGNNPGANGGNTTFGSLVTANGGTGGNGGEVAGGSGTGGAGGTASTSGTQILGAPGDAGTDRDGANTAGFGTNHVLLSGSEKAKPFGSLGHATDLSGGGSGGLFNDGDGGDGADGYCIVTPLN